MDFHLFVVSAINCHTSRLREIRFRQGIQYHQTNTYAATPDSSNAISREREKRNSRSELHFAILLRGLGRRLMNKKKAATWILDAWWIITYSRCPKRSTGLSCGLLPGTSERISDLFVATWFEGCWDSLVSPSFLCRDPRMPSYGWAGPSSVCLRIRRSNYCSRLTICLGRQVASKTSMASN